MIDFNSALRQSTLAASTMWAVGNSRRASEGTRLTPRFVRLSRRFARGSTTRSSLHSKRCQCTFGRTSWRRRTGFKPPQRIHRHRCSRIADLGEVRLVDAARLEMLTHPLGEGALLEPDGAEAPARNDVALDPRAAERNEQFADLVIGDCVWVARKEPVVEPDDEHVGRGESLRPYKAGEQDRRRILGRLLFPFSLALERLVVGRKCQTLP